MKIRPTAATEDLAATGNRRAPLAVLYRDSSLIAVHKPAGYVVHPTPLCPDAPAILQALRDQEGLFLYPVHRLDRATCGILMFALDQRVAGILCKLFRDSQVAKEYRALVRGWTAEEGEIDHAFADHYDGRRQEAVTRYRRLRRYELPLPVPPYSSSRYSLLAVRPLTGRTHQIRRHLKYISHPIVGDVTHGRSEHNIMFRDQFDCHQLLLQAVSLELPHPVSGDNLAIAAPMDGGFQRLLDRLDEFRVAPEPELF